MTEKRYDTQRDINPTPQAVFAMFHWHTEYANSRLGSMGFYDKLNAAAKRYCEEAVKRIRQAQKAHR